MDSIITSVILPRVGPVCPECLSRGHIPALRLSPSGVYSFGVAEPPAEIDWDIDCARRLISECPRPPQRVDLAWLVQWLTTRTTVTPEHLDHVPPEKLDEPAITVEVVAGPPGCHPRPFRILIAGMHRLVRKLRDGQAGWAYLLTEQEQASICTYRIRGQVAEMPTVPGWGIRAREAAIIVNSSAPRDHVA